MKIEFLKTIPDIELFPPVPAKKCVPIWYKVKEKEIEGIQQLSVGSNLSIKACMPVQDYILSGYIIKTHMDIIVKRDWNNDYGEELNIDFKFTDNAPISFHNTSQYPIKKNGHLKKLVKFTGYWGIKTPPGYSCLFYQPEYLNEQRFRILPGIVDTDTYVDPVHFPFTFSDFLGKTEFVIEAGTPIVCVLPFKRESWNHKICEYNKNNRTAILMRTIWQSAYRKFMHVKKNFN